MRETLVQERLYGSGVGAPDPSDIAFVRAIDGWTLDGDALCLLSGTHKDALHLLAVDLDIDAFAL